MAGNGQGVTDIPDKMYFRIGEVCRLTATKPFVLRYWETEFPMLQPVKTPKGHRLYRRQDIELVLEIKRLLYREGFTIAGARRHLREGFGVRGGNSANEPAPVAARPAPAQPMAAAVSGAERKLLLTLRDELRAILTLLERK